MPDNPSKTTEASATRRFAIALSFAGSHREKVRKIAELLRDKLGDGNVFYDDWFTHEILGSDMDVVIERIYHEQSLMIVADLSGDYADRPWCQVEARVIRALRSELDTARDETARLRLINVRFADGAVPGILSTEGWYEAKDKQAEEIAEFLLKRYHLLQERLGLIPTASLPSGSAQAGAAGQPQQCPADLSRILKYAPEDLIGRDDELRRLDDAWDKTVRGEAGRPHVLTFVALGGEGKTALVSKWAAERAGKDWPGCEAAFAWSFYSQGTREQYAASSDLFLKEALNFFGNQADKEFAASNAGAYEKGQRLAHIVGARHSLLILDGLEPLQYAPTSPTPGELKDQGIAALLKGLAANSRGLCLVTTRYSIPDLKAFRQNTAPEVKLERLSRAAGVHLLQKLGVRGSIFRNIPLNNGLEKVNEFEKLVEDVRGHALTLTLLGTYLRDAHGGDIRKRDLVKLEEADAESEHPHHAEHVMDAYVEWLGDGGKNEEENQKGRRALALLRLLGLFDRPATADCLTALWTGKAIPGLTEPLFGLTEAQRNIALTRLQEAKLLTVNREASGELISLDAHPHIREYFAKQLRENSLNAWRAAHKRLYEHLCKTTSDKKPNPTLDDLQPLYQAVAHGCQAGLAQDACDKVYWDRILRGEEFYSCLKLGAYGSDLGAVACFFKQPWREFLPDLTEVAQAWLLNQAAFCLRALSRLTEALEPMRAGSKMGIEQKNWQAAAIRASNLSELELTLGEVAGAVNDGQRSVSFADLSEDSFQKMARRTTHADALHQAGHRKEAEKLFREAEKIQAETQPEYPQLYSLPGFQYCDLLLADSEYVAWQVSINSNITNEVAEVIKICRTVYQRANQIFEWRKLPKWNPAYDPLLDIALDHLTLGRAALYEAILSQSKIENPKSEIEQAVAGLRRAGQAQELPRGLLTRAWWRALSGAKTGPDSAQEDLDEAWDIAIRGPMKLHMADIHLYRARLFFREAQYPWESPQADLAAARELIETCGYHRRDEELADAEKAILKK